MSNADCGKGNKRKKKIRMRIKKNRRREETKNRTKHDHTFAATHDKQIALLAAFALRAARFDAPLVLTERRLDLKRKVMEGLKGVQNHKVNYGFNTNIMLISEHTQHTYTPNHTPL